MAVPPRLPPLPPKDKAPVVTAAYNVVPLQALMDVFLAKDGQRGTRAYLLVIQHGWLENLDKYLETEVLR